MSDEDAEQSASRLDMQNDRRSGVSESFGDKQDAEVKWLADYDLQQNFDVDFGGEFLSAGFTENFYSAYSEEGLQWGEDMEQIQSATAFPYYTPAEAEEVEEEEEQVERFLYRVPSTVGKHTSRAPKPDSAAAQDLHRKSLYVHSSPTHFSDVNQARKSVFGSIFLRTTGNHAEDATLLKSVADCSYSMLHSLLNSYEKIISVASSDSDRRHMALAYKDSLLKALEVHGISRTYSDGSIHWNIYPMAHDYLFSVQVGDRIHQTRLLSKIEERILTGSLQKPRFPYAWPTDSVWTGYWDALGMAGVGTYSMPHGVLYSGKIVDGYFHDDNATLTYPNKFKALHCVFNKGKLQSCQFQFPDMLMHEKENWNYCRLPDRRFWSEVRNGLKPGKMAQKTEIDPPRRIPEGSYDTGDGFYHPKSLMLVSPVGELLRVPVCEEDIWIKKYCRKGFLEPADFRPDLYENWFNYNQELIQSILKGQEEYRAGKITYEELQQYFADLNLLPSWSKFKKKKTSSEIAMEEYLNSIPEPVLMRGPREVKKYQGHKLPSEIRVKCNASEDVLLTSSNQWKTPVIRPSKSLLRFHGNSRQKLTSSHGPITAKASKISFKLNESRSGSYDYTEPLKRQVPQKYLEYRQILSPAFGMSKVERSRPKTKKKCLPKSSSSSSSSSTLLNNFAGEDVDALYAALQKKEVKNFMKSIIMERVTDILQRERERHRKRLMWAQKPAQVSVPKLDSKAKCLKVLEELFESIPDKEEYCDSDPHNTCYLKQLAEDKYQMLKYWGKRMYMLDFKN